MALIRRKQIQDFSIRCYSHFLSNSGDWAGVASGTGATVNFATGINVVDDGGNPGIMPLRTGTTSTGFARYGLANVTPAPANLLLGFHEWEYDSIFTITGTLANSTQNFFIINGFSDGNTPVDGVFFRYNIANNANNWEIVTRSNSVETALDTGITVNTNWTKQQISINNDATEAKFFIDGLLVGIINSNIPVGAGRQTNCMLAIVSTAGTTSKGLNVDLMDLKGYS